MREHNVSRTQVAIDVTIDEFERYERLIVKKTEIEEIYLTMMQNRETPSKVFVRRYSKLIDAICRLEKSLEINDRISDGNEYLK